MYSSGCILKECVSFPPPKKSGGLRDLSPTMWEQKATGLTGDWQTCPLPPNNQNYFAFAKEERRIQYNPLFSKTNKASVGYTKNKRAF